MRASGSLDALRLQANELTSTLRILRAIHGKRAGAWSWAQINLTFLTAALAGLTAAGVVAEVGTAATIMALLAALSAAANVAIKPDERREKHRAAADGFGVLHDEVARFVGRDLEIESIDEKKVQELWDRFAEIEARFHEIGKQTINVARAFLAEATHQEAKAASA